MSAIDYGLAWDFIDPADGVPRQLRFERNWAPPGDPRVFDGTGQLVAVVADLQRRDNGHSIAISRDNVPLDAVETALDGWQSWAMLTSRTVNLAAIRRKIEAANLN